MSSRIHEPGDALMALLRKITSPSGKKWAHLEIIEKHAGLEPPQNALIPDTPYRR